MNKFQRKIPKISKKRDKDVKKPIIDGIKFASGTEGQTYKLLKANGFKPEYEQYKFTLMESIKPTVPFYTKGKKHSNLNFRFSELAPEMSRLRKTTYTPDFTFRYKDYFIIIEVKGVTYEDYIIKRKLFRHYLENTNEFGKIIFFEVYNIKMINQMIEIIKGL